MKYLRQSTAAIVVVGPFVAKADGVTPVTSLTTGSTLNGRLVKNGTGSAYTPGTFTHGASGHYLAALAVGDVDTIGRLRLHFSDPTTFLPVWEDYSVLSAALYDWFFGTVAPSAYAGADTPGTATLLSLLTPTRAGNLDDLDAPVSQRPTLAQIQTALTSLLGGVVVAGSGPASVIVSGLPAGRDYRGQHLYHGPSGEARLVATQSYAGGNYTLNFAGAVGTVAGPFSSVTAGDAVYPIP